MSTLQQGSQAELWQALIRESASRHAVVLDEHEESYLGFVLMRYQGDTMFASHTLALDWLRAHEEARHARADLLRDVGDRCLLLAGLFPQQAERRRVPLDYFVTLGRGAYSGVAECARAGYATLFAQLARAFLRLVEVLDGLRPQAAPRLLALASPPPGTRRH